MRRMLRTAGLVLAVGLVQPASAQEPNAGKDDPRVEALVKKIEVLERKHGERLEELERLIDALEAEAARNARAAAPKAQRLNVFNPRLTAFGNFIGRLDSDPVLTEEGDAIDDRLNLREVEVDFRAAVDPWADAVVITTWESEVPNSFQTEIEEGYVTLKKLPVLDWAPWGLKLKAGRYRPEFGRFNKIHTHDLPQVSRPLPLRAFLGEEGFIQNGVSAQFFVPTPGEGNTLEATVDLLNGGDLPAAAGNAGADPAALGHLKWFWDVAAGHDLEVGASYYRGQFDPAGDLDTKLYGIDFTYKWKPFGQGEWRSLLLGGELFAADIDQAGGLVTPLGYYGWGQYQFNRRTYLGARYDFTENVLDAAVESRSVGAFLSYYTTEFLRLRVGYEHQTSDVPALDNLDTGFVEVNFVFGSHPVEPYWVSR
ncbi:MAG: hypothetical protein ACE5EO_05165 [Candidatus Krumholzibacteriia bacterium]